MLSGEVTQNLPSDKLSTTATSDQTIFLLFWSLKKGLLLSYNFLKVFPHYLPYYFFKLSVFVDLHNKLIENILKLFLTSFSRVYIFSNQIKFFIRSNASGLRTLYFSVYTPHSWSRSTYKHNNIFWKLLKEGCNPPSFFT